MLYNFCRSQLSTLNKEGFPLLMNFAFKSIGVGLVSLVRTTRNSQTFHLDNFPAAFPRKLVTLTKEGSHLLLNHFSNFLSAIPRIYSQFLLNFEKTTFTIALKNENTCNFFNFDNRILYLSQSSW